MTVQKYFKILLFLQLSAMLLNSTRSIAQSYRLKEMTIGGINCCYFDCFEKKEDLDSIIIIYDKNEPVELFFKSEKDKTDQNKRSYYYLKFPADVFFLKRNYPDLKIPKYPIIDLIITDKKYDKKNEFITYTGIAILTRDSLKYILTEWLHKETLEQRQLSAIPYEGFKAKYKRGDTKLEESLNQDIQLVKNQIQESHYLFKGIVDEKGTLSNILILLGDDNLANQILHSLNQSEAVWQPAMQGGRHVKSYIEIFVQIKDGSLKVFTCGLNR